MNQSIIFLSSALLITAFALLLRKKSSAVTDTVLKILVLVFCVVGFFRLMLSDSFMFVINGGYYGDIYYEATDPLQTVLRWGYYLCYAVLPMAVFFESRLFRNIACYVCLPFSLLSVFYYNDFMRYFLAEEGRGLHLWPTFRYVYFALELILALSIPILLAITKRHIFRVKDMREWTSFLVATPLIALLMIPVYAPQSLFGYSEMIASKGSDYHVAWIVLLLAVTLALYYAFRFRSYRERYMLVVFLTIVLFFHYDSLYLMGFSIPRLPIQLCNLAAYFYMIAILGKRQKMFQFCFLANVTGALIAILMPDFTPGAFGFWNMHFVLEHSLVMMIPALAMGLRIFERPQRSSLKYTWVGFSIYFLFCLTSGVLLNGYADVTGFEVNYFFLFDLEKAFSVLPFMKFTERFCLQFGRFHFYPLFVALIYVVFLGLCLAFYYAVRFFNKMEDDHLALRGAAIDLHEKRSGKICRIPREFID